MTIASAAPSSALFLSTKTSIPITKLKRRAIKENPFRCSCRHGQNLHTSHRNPKVLLRLSLDNCFNFFVSGIILSSISLSFDPIARALDSAKVQLNYPCEDVSGYYSGVDGLSGAALMKELGCLVSGHKSLPYKEVWEALKILDAADVENPEASTEVTSFSVNSSRGNKYYGECGGISTHCHRPANQEAAPDTETDKQRWAPPLQVRGDIARSVMYMAVHYGFLQPDGNPYLLLSDSPNIERREMGLLSALLKWNDLDPPSREEQLRNDRVCRFYQHNRNPFVDHPEYANLIWKHSFPSSPAAFSSSLKAWLNEFHYDNKGKDQNEFVEIIARSSTDASILKLILYNGANGRAYRSLSLADEQAFTVSDAGSGFLIYTAFITLQNGPAEGIALVSGEDGDQFEVLQFLSYEGRVKAADGPAQGMESLDIMAKETEASSENDSIGLGGQRISEFEWRTFIGKASPGKLNIGQKIY